MECLKIKAVWSPVGLFSVRFGQSERYTITVRTSANLSEFVTEVGALFGNPVTVICPSLPYNGQSNSALAFYNNRIDSSLFIFKAPEDKISGATPNSIACPFLRNIQCRRLSLPTEEIIVRNLTYPIFGTVFKCILSVHGTTGCKRSHP